MKPELGRANGQGHRWRDPLAWVALGAAVSRDKGFQSEDQAGPGKTGRPGGPPPAGGRAAPAELLEATPRTASVCDPRSPDAGAVTAVESL